MFLLLIFSVKRPNGIKDDYDAELKSDCVACINGYTKLAEFAKLRPVFSKEDSASDSIIFPIKSRVVTYYHLNVKAESISEHLNMFNCVYFSSGTVGEAPSVRNLHRYLIFFDNGYVSYVHASHVFPILNIFHLPTERLHIDHVNYLFKYFATLNTTKGDESEKSNAHKWELTSVGEKTSVYVLGKWYPAVCTELDMSVARIKLSRPLPCVGQHPNASTYSFQVGVYIILTNAK